MQLRLSMSGMTELEEYEASRLAQANGSAAYRLAFI